MQIKAIITGDIVDSTKQSLEERIGMLSALNNLPNILLPIDKVELEIYRGDGFQIGSFDVKNSLRIAICIRAFLRCHYITQCKVPLDAKIALGIGTVEFPADSLSQSDGNSFRVSGRLLDSMKKRRLEILTPWDNVNAELAISTAFADEIISSWTPSQSKIALESYLYSSTNNEIADKLGITQQMVSKSLKASKETLIKAYIERFETLISGHISLN